MSLNSNATHFNSSEDDAGETILDELRAEKMLELVDDLAQKINGITMLVTLSFMQAFDYSPLEEQKEIDIKFKESTDYFINMRNILTFLKKKELDRRCINHNNNKVNK